MEKVDEEVSMKLPHSKATLHDIVQEFRSPSKQAGKAVYTGTPIRTNKPKRRTMPCGDLQRSLTPELKAACRNDLTNRSPSPKSRNTAYRNKRVDIDKSIASPGPDQLTDRVIVTPKPGSFDNFGKGTNQASSGADYERQSDEEVTGQDFSTGKPQQGITSQFLFYLVITHIASHAKSDIPYLL